MKSLFLPYDRAAKWDQPYRNLVQISCYEKSCCCKVGVRESSMSRVITNDADLRYDLLWLISPGSHQRGYSNCVLHRLEVCSGELLSP